MKNEEKLLLSTVTVLDPRFKKLQWFEKEKQAEVYELLKQAMMREVPESSLSYAKIKTEQELSGQVKEEIDSRENSPEKKKPKQEDDGLSRERS